MPARPERSRARILIVGDAVAPTGFARVVRGIFAPLAERYDLHQLAVNYFGDPHDWPWKLYPAQRPGDPSGVSRLPQLITYLAPDLVFVLTDIWRFAAYGSALEKLGSAPPAVLYCPVEAGPIAPEVVAPLGGLDHLVLYTRYGEAAIAAGARSSGDGQRHRRLPPTSVLPHGVDTTEFFPLAGGVDENALGESRARARATLFPDTPEYRQAFVVLNGNRNQPRKRIDVTMEGFALFARDKPPDVKLYLHMGLEDLGWNIPALGRRLGIYDRLIATYGDNQIPQASTSYLNTIYNACDVGINTAMAEGWGLVAFEHAATGAPQIVPGFGACAELWQGAAELLPATRTVTQEGSLMECSLIDPVAAAAAMERLYRDREHRRRLGRAAYELATRGEYQWPNIATRWAELFDGLIAESRRPRRRRAGTPPPRLTPPYVFLHVPKTGGTSFGEILRKAVGSEDFGHYWSPPAELSAAEQRELRQKQFLFGHFPHGIHRLLGRPCTYLTALRNPFERTLSHYYFHLHNTADPGHRFARDHSLAEWLDLHPDAWDLQVQFLSGRKGAAPDRAALELAKENLAACGLVGLLEDFEGTLLLLRFYLGLDIAGAPRLKENPQRPRLHEVPDEAREKIFRCNALDFELYRLGQELFGAQLHAAMAATEAMTGRVR